MTFPAGRHADPRGQRAWHAGLQVLLEADRNRIQTGEPRRLRGSVNVEECLTGRYPEQRQWQDGVGFHAMNLIEEVIYWI